MPAKMTGAEYKRFMTDTLLWGKDGKYAYAYLFVDGQEEHEIDLDKLADTAEVRIEGGYVIDLPGDDVMSLVGLFQKWKKLQDTDTFMTLQEQFEAWAQEAPREWSIAKHSEWAAFPGQYRDYHVYCAWEAWEARSAIEAKTLP